MILSPRPNCPLSIHSFSASSSLRSAYGIPRKIGATDRQNSLWVFRIADGGKECICQTKYLCLFFVEGKVVFCGKGIADRIRKHLPILRDFADKAQSLRNENPLLIAIFLYF